MKKISFSIKVMNYILFLLVIYFNIFSYFLTDLKSFKIFFLVTNLIFISLFFLVNFLFNREKIFQDKGIKAAFDYENNVKLISKKIKYIENKENYKIFRNIYIYKE